MMTITISVMRRGCVGIILMMFQQTNMTGFNHADFTPTK